MLYKVNATPSPPGTFTPPPEPVEPDHHAVNLAAARYGGSLDDPQCKDMILVMGNRGAGKSLFINTLVGGSVAQVGDGITPCMYIPMIV